MKCGRFLSITVVLAIVMAGVTGVNAESWTTYNNSNTGGAIGNNTVNCAAVQSGVRWFGTNGGGLAKYNGTTWVKFTSAAGLAGNTVNHADFDSSGNLWVATGTGLSKYVSSSWTKYNTGNSGIAANNCLTVAAEGTTIWIGLYANGVNKYDGTTWINYTSANSGLANNRVYDAVVDGSGNKWFATNTGVSKYNGTTWTNYTTAQGLASNVVKAAALDSSGNLWVGTSGGVNKYNGTSWSKYTSTDGLAENDTLSIEVASNDVVWAGSNGSGVTKFASSSWTKYNTTNGLANNTVNGVDSESSTLLWFATSGGVSKYDFSPPAPDAQFSGSPTSGNVPLTVNFTDSSTNTPTSWSWTFGDSGTSTLQNPSHQYTSAGTYTVSLTATNASGSDIETKTNYIVINAVSPPVANFSGSPTSGYVPLTVNFTDSSTNTPTSWSWTFGDSGTSTAQNPSHQYTSVGTYTVSLTATNAGGSDIETKTNYIVVNAVSAPVANFSGSPTSGAVPLTVNFTDSSTNTPTSWSWTFGDSGTSTAQNPSHQYTSAGTYTVSLTASNAGGSDDETKTSYIAVSSPYIKRVNSGGSAHTDSFGKQWSADQAYTSGSWGYVGGSVLTTTDSIANTVEDVLYQSQRKQDFSYKFDVANGNYDVTLYFAEIDTDRSGVREFDVTIEGTLKLDNYDIYAHANAHDYAISENFTNIAVSDGQLNIVFTDVKDRSLVAALYVRTAGVPAIGFSGSPTSGNYPLNVSFTDSSTGSISNWSWTFGDSGTSTQQNPSHVYNSAGTFSVSLTVNGPVGSESLTKTNYITVSTPPVPVANFTGSPTTGDYPLTVNFTDTTTGTATSWSWTFGDSGTSTLQNPSHIYNTQGTYTVSLTAIGPSGSDVETKNNYITVNIPPPPSANFTGSPVTGDQPLTVNFTNTTTGSATSWSWTFGDSGTSTQQNPSHQYQNVGTYTVSLTAVGIGGSDVETKTGYITVTTPPIAGLSSTSVVFTNVPAGSTTSQTVQLSNTGGRDLAWELYRVVRHLEEELGGEGGQMGGMSAAAEALEPLISLKSVPRPARSEEELFRNPNNYGPDRLCVKVKAGALNGNSFQSSVSKVGMKLKKVITKARKMRNRPRDMFKSDWVVLTSQEPIDLKAARRDLLKNPDIEYVEPDYIIRLDRTIPNDGEFKQQWDMDNSGNHGGVYDADIDAPEAWDLWTGADNVIVGVIDTGVDYTHQDIADNIWTNPGEIPGNWIDDDHNGYVDDVHGYDFVNVDADPMDDNGHGSHCSCTIAGVGNNSAGLAGVCWTAKIMALKFLSGWGSGWESDAVEALYYANAMGATITSNSWGGTEISSNLIEALEYTEELGNLFVVAAGNAGWDNDVQPFYPAAADSNCVISVAATDFQDQLASFSCYGLTTVDIGAPGVDIYSCVCCYDEYEVWSGTSMACPHVAGVAALLKSFSPFSTGQDIKQAILDGADPIPALDGKCVSGGRLNAYNALKLLAPPWLTLSPDSGSVAPSQNQNLTIGVYANSLAPGTYLSTITISTNDPQHPTMAIDVNTTVTAYRRLSANYSSIDFGVVERLDPNTALLKLTNGGSSATTISSISFSDPNFACTANLPLVVGGFDSNLVSVVFTPNVIGDYNATMTISSNAQDNPTININLSGEAIPITVAADFSASETLGHSPMDVNFTDISKGDHNSWSWTFGDGGTSTAQNPSHTYSNIGTYTVSLSITGAGGSSSKTKTDYIIVSNSNAVFSPNSVTFNLVCGQIADQNVVISNTGTNQLKYEVTGIEFDYVFNGASLGNVGALQAAVTERNTAKPQVRIIKPPKESEMFKGDYAPNELVVKLRPGCYNSVGVQTAYKKAGMYEKHLLTRARLSRQGDRYGEWVVLGSDDPKFNIKKACRELLKNPNVLYVEPAYIVQSPLDSEPPQTTEQAPTQLMSWEPNDPCYASQQWYLHNDGSKAGSIEDADIHAPEGWGFWHGGENTVIGVWMGGVDYNHPDLAANIWTNPGEIPNNGIDDDHNGYIDDVHGYNFWYHDTGIMDYGTGQGTEQAGLIAAVGDNGIGLSGVCPHCKIAVLAVFTPFPAPHYSVGEAAFYANAMGIEIQNHSYYPYAGYYQNILDALEEADTLGYLAVMCAGTNQYLRGTNYIGPPAYYADLYGFQNTLVVGGSTNADQRDFISNWDVNVVDLFAPCGCYTTAYNFGAEGYNTYSMTNSSSSLVAGMAGLLKDYVPAASGKQIKKVIMDSVDQKASLANTCKTGGRANLYNAFVRLGVRWLTASPSSGSVAVSGSQNLKVTADATYLAGGVYTARIRVKTNAPDNPEQVINVTLDVAGTKSLNAAPSSLDFNDVPIGQYAKMELLLTNTGNHPTTINSINITDSTFTHNGLLPLTVAPWSSTALVVTFAPTAMGSKNATMTISSDANDHPSIQISLAGNGAPVPVVADFSADPTSGLPPLDVSFTDQSEGIVTSWSWNFGDGHTSTAQNPTHTYDANTAGAYSVSLAVSGPYGSDSTTKTYYIIINEGQWTTYTQSSTGGGLPNNNIRDFVFNTDSSIWVATNAGGIAKFKAGSWTKYTTANSGIANNAVWDLEYDGSANLWIATNGGVSKFNGSSFTKYTSSNSGLSDNNTRSVAVGSNGSTMWFGTVGGGACKFNGTSWTAYKTTNSPIPHNTVNAVDVDSAGNKWFGTLGGAAKFTDSSWTVYTTQLPSNSVYDVVVDSGQNVWFATTAGVSKFNGSSWTTYEVENGMPDENTRCVNFDPNGIMWVGTNAAGVCRYNGTNWRQYTTSNSGLANNAVWAVGIEHPRRIWLGTNGGVNVYDICGGIILDGDNKNKPKK